jgi:hypothetical protein
LKLYKWIVNNVDLILFVLQDSSLLISSLKMVIQVKKVSSDQMVDQESMIKCRYGFFFFLHL